jgi:hypothetical protein
MPWKIVKCKICDIDFNSYIRPKSYTQTCSKKCLKILKSQIFSGSGNPAFGKTYRTKVTHPEWAAQISSTHKECGTLVGDKNPMKRKDVAVKMSKTRRENVTSDPVYLRHLAEAIAKKWADGDYEGVRVGQCKWHDFVKKSGEVVKCQGLWELEYAKYLDDNNVSFYLHKDRLSYVDDEGMKRSYYPDFLLSDGSYVDVKNPYYEKIHARKIELVRLNNPDVKLEILGVEKLRMLGLKLSGFSDGRKDVTR